MPRSSTSVMGLDDEKGRQELRPRGPSSMLPLSSVIKDAFDKFEHDFQAANLPEGKYIKPPPSTAKWYKVGQPCYKDKIQELNTDFAKICFYCVNISYLVDQCICPARSRSRQTLDKNVLSWALTGTGSVIHIRQVS